MAVLSGSATIRFGVADLDDDMDVNANDSRAEEACIEVKANVGNDFVLPAGTAHESFDVTRQL